ncbi:MAG: thioredoxin family protein [Anaerolineales bacterium]|nr:thioredoxin family protein [Anaerolineales bacterium]MDW8227781.1 thioredoxin family protein [Anaerolineales bacterium]
MAKLLNEHVEKQVRDVFEELKAPVHILFFGSQDGCEYCEDTRQLVEEVAALSDKISLSVYDLETDAETARTYQIDKSPALVIAGKEGDQIIDYGVRFFGIPAGHEFTSLIQDIVLVSGRDSGLSPSTREFLKSLKQPVHLEVFVTPTCPYCPRAVILAHMMAMETPMIKADMVEAMEFPALADRHHVSGVPHTVINDGAGNVVGAVPEASLVNAIRQALRV